MRIGVTLTSSLEVGEEYIQLTKRIAGSLAKRGMGIVYGGTNYGMMATLAESYKESGGRDLTGVMAQNLIRVTKNYTAYEGLDTSFLEETMEDRMRKIVGLSDAFIILPGGYGTLEEIGTIVGGKANKLFDKPIAFYNYKGFYDTFLAFMGEMYSKQFSKIPITDLILISQNIDEIIAHFQNYKQKELVDKFVR